MSSSKSYIVTIDMNAVIAALIDINKVNLDIEQYRNQLSKKTEQRTTDFENMIAKINENYHDDLKEDIDKVLEREQKKLKMELTVQMIEHLTLVEAKRENIMQPIHDKIEKVVRQLIDERGITQVINHGAHLYYTSPDQDITQDVIQRLTLED
ncbi:hypothetical protein GCM10009117_11890 [Gangjinia marincola]|uniref:OmpH family outer membrane protein n=1 Tax=Gangjinia marincola TaxID=578463 RepID=A0ABN1MFW0_9FLAO